MALFNENQVGRFNRFVQKLLSMKGPPTMPTVASDLQFMIPFNNGVENRYLEGWNKFTLTLAITGSAGNVALLEVRNPTTSNAVAVIEKATINEHLADPSTGGSTGAQFFAILNATSDQTNVVQAQRLDARTQGSSSMRVSHNNGAAVTAVGGSATAVGLVGLVADQTYNFIATALDEIPVVPGAAVYIANGVAAQLATITLQWRERYLEDSERA